MSKAESYMQRCLDLAALGQDSVSPNPMVGALLVYQDRIIGEGYHERFGGKHAEVHALDQALKKNDPETIRKSTLYVSLEPCAHQGKTPACTERIIREGIPHVVIACTDPFPAVQGKGIEQLKAAGLQVEVGVLEAKARFLNRRFFTRVEKQRPYIILKWAQTHNGYFAPLQGQQWISGAESSMLNHRWRTQEDAILVGTNTVLTDNPRLNPRDWEGPAPIRLILDRNLVIPESALVFQGDQPSIIFTEKEKKGVGNLRYISMESFDFYLAESLAYQCYLLDIQSIIVEGGKKTLDLFLHAGIADEIRVIRSSDDWEAGIEAPKIHRTPDYTTPLGKDTLELYYM